LIRLTVLLPGTHFIKKNLTAKSALSMFSSATPQPVVATLFHTLCTLSHSKSIERNSFDISFCFFRNEMSANAQQTQITMTGQVDTRSISPNFVRQVKSCWQTTFGEKLVIQLQQHSVALIKFAQYVCKVKFDKLICCLSYYIFQKKASNLVGGKKLRAYVGEIKS